VTKSRKVGPLLIFSISLYSVQYHVGKPRQYCLKLIRARLAMPIVANRGASVILVATFETI